MTMRNVKMRAGYCGKHRVQATRALVIGASLICALLPMRVEAQPQVQENSRIFHHKQVAIVIDDFGSNMQGTKEMFELPITFTAAVMPFLPTTKRDAEWAHRTGNEVIVHLPMEPLSGNTKWLGPGAITTDLSDAEIRRRVNAAVDDVPYAVGMNNHMGSKATADERVMRVVLEVCRERGLVYLDSKTNYRSVAGKVAREVGAKYAENHLFLDDVHTERHIAKQFKLITDYLSDHDRCVAIGHVGARGGKRTANVLKKNAEQMKEHVDFVPVSQIAH